MTLDLLNAALMTGGPPAVVYGVAKFATWMVHLGGDKPKPAPQRPAPGPRPAIRASAQVARHRPRTQPVLEGEVLPARTRRLESGEAR
jgi:hypothetical protein